jgi:hypothetical protein
MSSFDLFFFRSMGLFLDVDDDDGPELEGGQVENLRSASFGLCRLSAGQFLPAM